MPNQEAVVPHLKAVMPLLEAVVPHKEAHFASKGVFLPYKKTMLFFCCPHLPFVPRHGVPAWPHFVTA